jgi:4-amino-4-deoxy-L-arabinose transferase-like glycosyltransferase
LDILIISLLCIPLAQLTAGTLIPLERYITFGDSPFFLNRGVLLLRGIVDEGFVYTFTYPVLVAIIYAFTHNLIVTGVILNALAYYALILGTYLLGRLFYKRQVGWLSAFIVAFNHTFFLTTRLTQPFLTFYALVVWCVLVYVWVVRRPSILTAILLGLILTVTFYARLEGGSYIILIPLAAWQVYRSTGKIRLPILITVIGCSIFALGAIFYLAILSRISDTSNGDVFTFLTILRSSSPLQQFWARAVETGQMLLGGVSVLVTAGALLGVFWREPDDSAANCLFLLLIDIGIANLFVLSAVPKLYMAVVSVPFLAVLCAAFIIRFAARWRWTTPFLVIGMVIVLSPGIVSLIQYASFPHTDYRQSPTGQIAAAVDNWLTANGYQDTEVYTFCSGVITYSESNFHLIYRMAFGDRHSPKQANSPLQLMPILREKQKLFMRCNNDVNIPYRDWNDFLEHPANFPDQLQEIGRVGDYIFYKVVAQPQPT